MKKPKINLNWPVIRNDFVAASTANGAGQNNEVFSRGKLKVFYKGETADHRYFSDAFAEKLLKSLPYTPVVGYYDEESKDFHGHAPEQAIYGIVDPCKPPYFEKDEDGKEWCVCDVVIYTERAGKIGEIAKQIVGHKQSLEMTDAKYIINYDNHRHFKNIEFTDGKFVGVSVLGSNQEPAFTGSQFFEVASKGDFEQKLKLLRDYCAQEAMAAANNNTKERTSNGGVTMHIANYSEFRKLTWGEVAAKLDETLAKEYGAEAYTNIEDRDNEFVYVKFFSYLDGSVTLYRIQYSLADDGSIQLGERKPVHRVWEVVEVAPSVPADEVAATTQEPTKVSDDRSEEASTDGDTSQQQLSSSLPAEPGNQDSPDTDAAPEAAAPLEVATAGTNAAAMENSPDNNSNLQKIEATTEDAQQQQLSQELQQLQPSSLQQSPDDNNGDGDAGAEALSPHFENSNQVAEDSATAAASAPALDQSEREQFEALKKQEKLNFLNSYKDKLDDEDFQRFTAELDNYSSKESLEVEVLRAALAHAQEEKSSVRRAAFYSCAANGNNASIKKGDNDSNDDSWVKRALHR